MPIVFACAASHAPGMTAWTEAAPKAQADNFLGNYRKLGARLAGAKPDVIVALTVEHWANWFSQRHARLLHRPRRALRRPGRRMAPDPQNTSARRRKIGNAIDRRLLGRRSRSDFLRRIAARSRDLFAAAFLKSQYGYPDCAGDHQYAHAADADGKALLRARRVSRPGVGKKSKTNRTDRNRWSVALARRGEARKNQRSLRQNVFGKSNQRQSRAFDCVQPR